MDARAISQPSPVSEQPPHSGTNFFTGAHGFRIEQQTNIVNYSSATDLYSLLNPIPDASFTRDRRVSPPDSHCLPGTRQALIKRIQSWVDSSTLLKPQHVMWIYGYVGCGKSSIAQAISEVYSRKNRLIASFFFFRGSGDRAKTQRFAATVAGQLAAAVPEIAAQLEKAIRAQAGLLTSCPLSTQFEYLIYRPLKAFLKANPLKPSIFRDPYLIVIDGLDECEDREEIAAFIDHMLKFFDANPRIPLRFLITSRVEEHLRNHLDSKQVHLMNLVDHTTLDDVSAVVDATFAMAAKHDRVIRAYGNWPSSEDRQKLMEHSGGSLIFTSTILKFILGESTDGLTPMERLPLALNINPGLDGLYKQTLSRSEHLPHFLEIVAVIVLFADASPTITDVAMFLGIKIFEVVRVLVNLHSILQVPGDDDTPVTICHTSLREFLQDEPRSQSFHLSPALSNRICERAIEPRQDDDPTLRFITAIHLLLGSLPISALVSLLDIHLPNLTRALWQFVLNLPAGELGPGTRVGPSVLRPPFRRFLQSEARSAFIVKEKQQLVDDCLRCIAKELPALGFETTRYSSTYVREHWNSVLEATDPSVFPSALREALSRLRILFTHRTVDNVLVLLLSLEGDKVATRAGISFDSLMNPLLLRKWEAIIVWVIASILQSFVLHSGSNSLKDIEPSIIDDVCDMDVVNLRDLAATHLALLSMREGRNGIWFERAGSTYLADMSDLGILENIAQRAQGSPIFISELTRFVVDVRDRTRPRDRPAVHASVIDALESMVPLDRFHTRILAHCRNSLFLISIISMLAEPLSVNQLSFLTGISSEDILLNLRSLRGIIHFPEDGFASRTVGIPPQFRAFLRDQSRAGTLYRSEASLHHQLAKMCLQFWFHWVPDSDLNKVKEYCQRYWIRHWEAGQGHEPMQWEHTHGHPTDATKGHSDTVEVSLATHQLDIPIDGQKLLRETIIDLTRYLSTLSSYSTVEVALRTHLRADDGLSTMVGTLLTGHITDLNPGIHSLGCKADVSGVERGPLLACAEILLSLHRHYERRGLP
ncbi:hypothetical protein NMY22_g7419 [Coprinellus aureogranulatus]|nr:hypothetical protein NMY22_g7419 [Coprinellus aureogranulatus]